MSREGFDAEDYHVKLSLVLYGRLDLVEMPLIGVCIRQSFAEGA